MLLSRSASSVPTSFFIFGALLLSFNTLLLSSGSSFVTAVAAFPDRCDLDFCSCIADEDFDDYTCPSWMQIGRGKFVGSATLFLGDLGWEEKCEENGGFGGFKENSSFVVCSAFTDEIGAQYIPSLNPNVTQDNCDESYYYKIFAFNSSNPKCSITDEYEKNDECFRPLVLATPSSYRICNETVPDFITAYEKEQAASSPAIPRAGKNALFGGWMHTMQAMFWSMAFWYFGS